MGAGRESSTVSTIFFIMIFAFKKYVMKICSGGGDEKNKLCTTASFHFHFWHDSRMDIFVLIHIQEFQVVHFLGIATKADA